jgi:hypothetical protein
MYRLVTVLGLLTALVSAQSVRIQDARLQKMPGEVDSNSPAFWRNGQFHLINSTGLGPFLSTGVDQFNLGNSRLSTISRPQRDWPTWIEALWVDPSGPIFAFYHQEQEYLCAGKQRPALPRIGAAISFDDGRSFSDLGIILSAAQPADCTYQNQYFAGGHGDFSVVLDQQRAYFYFLFTNYAGPVAHQGVVVARMRYEDRFSPVNRVWKYSDHDWSQPGIGGRTTPIFPTKVSWQRPDTDSFWGPSIHWNTHLKQFVILMNRSCCSTGWPQEGVYVSFNPDLADPKAWAAPSKLQIEGYFWYPQVLGLGPEETDTLAGKRARLYTFGGSKWEIEFLTEAEVAAAEQPNPEERQPEPEPDAPQPEPVSEPPTPEEPAPSPEPATPLPPDPAAPSPVPDTPESSDSRTRAATRSL